MANRDAEVIIVGAGIAGLSAAEHLYRNGFKKIKILEARDRIGGRIWTSQFGADKDGFVELGAQYFGGLVHSCSVYTLANQIGLKANPRAHDQPIRPSDLGHVYSSAGHLIDSWIVNRCNELFDEWWNNLEDVDRTITMEQSFTEYLNKVVLPEFEDEDEAEDVRSYFNYFRNWLRLMEGIAPSDYMLNVDKDPNAPEVLPGKSHEAAGRLSGLINEISRRFPSEFINLSAPVTHIKWGKDKTELSCSLKGKQTTLVADYVVVTCPLGYLKKVHETMFEPRLPQKKVEAIEIIPFGCIGKIFLEYDKPFWNMDIPESAIAWTDKDFSEDVGDEWWKRITHMEGAQNSKNVFLVWVSAEGAVKAGQLSNEEVAEKITWLLRKLFRNPSIPEPRKVLKSDWAHDPWTYGVYGSKGSSTSVHRMDLGAPLTVGDTPRVLFAGEATDLKSCGFMHGGRDSGFRAAEEIIQSDNKSANTTSRL